MQYVSSHAISSIQLTQLVVLDGASKDAQNPSFTLLLPSSSSYSLAPSPRNWTNIACFIQDVQIAGKKVPKVAHKGIAIVPITASFGDHLHLKGVTPPLLPRTLLRARILHKFGLSFVTSFSSTSMWSTNDWLTLTHRQKSSLGLHHSWWPHHLLKMFLSFFTYWWIHQWHCWMVTKLKNT